MTDQTVFEYSEIEWQKIKSDNPQTYNNCEICNTRLVLNRCKEDLKQEHYYCPKHCPQHQWQSTYDWPVQCAICGATYTEYLVSILEKHKIPFNKY